MKEFFALGFVWLMVFTVGEYCKCKMKFEGMELEGIVEDKKKHITELQKINLSLDHFGEASHHIDAIFFILLIPCGWQLIFTVCAHPACAETGKTLLWDTEKKHRKCVHFKMSEEEFCPYGMALSCEWPQVGR